MLWSFLGASLQPEPRSAFLHLLGSHPRDERNAKNTANSEQDKTSEMTLSGDAEAIIYHAVLLGQFESAVDMCLLSNQYTEALMFALAGGAELVARTQKAVLARRPSRTNTLFTSILDRSWSDVITRTGILLITPDIPSYPRTLEPSYPHTLVPSYIVPSYIIPSYPHISYPRSPTKLRMPHVPPGSQPLSMVVPLNPALLPALTALARGA